MVTFQNILKHSGEGITRIDSTASAVMISSVQSCIPLWEAYLQVASHNSICIHVYVLSWPLTLKVNRIHPLTLVHICQVWWRCTQRLSLYHVHKVKAWRTHPRRYGQIEGTTATLLYSLLNVLPGDNLFVKWRYLGQAKKW